MKRFLPLEGEVLLGSAEAVIELPTRAVGALALEITLLLEGLAKTLRIGPGKGPTLQLMVIESHPAAKAVVTCESVEFVSFAVNRNQAEYLQAVLLRAYRDQMAEVNHVHIEGTCNGSPFDLTVMFEAFREPMSAEDASRLLSD